MVPGLAPTDPGLALVVPMEENRRPATQHHTRPTRGYGKHPVFGNRSLSRPVGYLFGNISKKWGGGVTPIATPGQPKPPSTSGGLPPQKTTAYVHPAVPPGMLMDPLDPDFIVGKNALYERQYQFGLFFVAKF